MLRYLMIKANYREGLCRMGSCERMRCESRKDHNVQLPNIYYEAQSFYPEGKYVQFRLKCVVCSNSFQHYSQYQLLMLFPAYLLIINDLLHDYFLIYTKHNIPTIASCREYVFSFIYLSLIAPSILLTFSLLQIFAFYLIS